MRGTLVGPVNGQKQILEDSVNVAYLTTKAIKPEWKHIEAKSKAGAIDALNVVVNGFRHTIGMRSSYFFLVQYPHGTLFSLVTSHIFLEASSRELLHGVAVSYYQDQNIQGPPVSCVPWARYVRHALRIQESPQSFDAYWRKDLAPSRYLKSFHFERSGHLDADPQTRRSVEILTLPLDAISTALGVSAPVLAETAFVLAVSLYWSQLADADEEPALYSKVVQSKSIFT